MARMRHSDAALRELARYSIAYVSHSKPPRKCVVVDLDGTLWGGIWQSLRRVPSRPTARGIEFVDFQQALLNLTKRGIVRASARRTTRTTSCRLARAPRHGAARGEFAALRINWRTRPRTSRIAESSTSVSTRLVFLDDTPGGARLVRQTCPRSSRWSCRRMRHSIARCSRADGLWLLALRRDQQRPGNTRPTPATDAGALERVPGRVHALARDPSRDRPGGGSHVPRLARCSTRRINSTRRRDATRLRTWSGSARPKTVGVYVLEVSDRFGEHGLVGAAIVAPAETRDVYVDSFLLSCRVMGCSWKPCVEADLRSSATSAASRGWSGIRSDR